MQIISLINNGNHKKIINEILLLLKYKTKNIETNFTNWDKQLTKF